MGTYKFQIGPQEPIEQLYPDPKFANSDLNFTSYQDVIKHYTKGSLAYDSIPFDEVKVTLEKAIYWVTVTADSLDNRITLFGDRLRAIMSPAVAQKAIRGMELLKEMNVWNPMEGYHVNKNAKDGKSKWALFPPLGSNVMGQKGLLLMHYPPWISVQEATADNSMTMERWARMLKYSGVNESEITKYKTIIDVNPVSAPGSGESEYPNDYFPIMMAAGFFDGGPDRDYIRSMLDLYLTPPDWPDTNEYTLPIIICGSSLYDPQAPGWFRTAYTDILPQDDFGIPNVDVLQTGKFRVSPDSKRETPFMIANHMIAAGVTGRCTTDPSKIPDIRKYEAQDLVAATFLKLYSDNPNQDPADVKAKACQRWFGSNDGKGAPSPADPQDQTTICALAQMDLFFERLPAPHPKYTFEEAAQRCQTMSNPLNDPCAPQIKPNDR